MLSVTERTTSNASNVTNNSKPARPTGNATTSGYNRKKNNKKNEQKNSTSIHKNATAKRGSKANATNENKTKQHKQSRKSSSNHSVKTNETGRSPTAEKAIKANKSDKAKAQTQNNSRQRPSSKMMRSNNSNATRINKDKADTEGAPQKRTKSTTDTANKTEGNTGNTTGDLVMTGFEEAALFQTIFPHVFAALYHNRLFGNDTNTTDGHVELANGTDGNERKKREERPTNQVEL